MSICINTVFVKCASDTAGLLGKENESFPDCKNKWVPSSLKSRRECSYCHKMGHVMAECHSLKRKQEQQEFLPIQPLGFWLSKNSPFALFSC